MPGIGFAEWGPGDMGLAFGYTDAHDPPYPDDMEAARQRIRAALHSAGAAFLCGWNDHTTSVEDRVRKLLDEGVKILAGVGALHQKSFCGSWFDRLTTNVSMKNRSS